MLVTSAVRNVNLRKLLLITLVLGAIISPFALVDNRDKDSWLEEAHYGKVSVRGSRFLQENNHEHLKNEYEAKKHASIKDLLQENENICLGGRNPSTMTLEEQIEAFNNGPCSPVVLVPGLAGTSLQVQINCVTLQTSSPDIFKGCGWSTCSSFAIWGSRPNDEYRLWISSLNSPVSMITASKKSTCFGDIIQLLYDPTQQDISRRYSDIPGVKVTYYGDTPQTQSNGDCGSSAIGELTDDYFVKLTTCEHKGFSSINEMLKKMGFVSGVTFQAIPYDFRKNMVSLPVKGLIKKSIEKLKHVTGKKVVMFTHSLGSLQALYALTSVDQEWKDSHIATLMTMGGPYLGSTRAVRSVLGGDPSYLDRYLGHDVGVNYYNQVRAINSDSSGLDLFPKDTYIRFRDQPWMKEIHKRIAWEKEYLEGKTPTQPIPLDWFPGPDKNCTHGFDTRPDSCLTFLEDLSEPYLNIGDQYFTSSKQATKEVLDKAAINNTLLIQYYEESVIEEIDILPHPGVPTILVYGGFLSVELKFQYDQNPKDIVTQTNDFYFPNVTKFSQGDGTVITTSAITPAIKWIWEHQNQKHQYPTKLIEFCGTYQTDLSIYDSVDTEGRKIFTQSGYSGLECECLTKSKKLDCKHSCMINDRNMVDLLTQVVLNNQKSVHQNGVTPVNSLLAFKNECTIINS